MQDYIERAAIEKSIAHSVSVLKDIVAQLSASLNPLNDTLECIENIKNGRTSAFFMFSMHSRVSFSASLNPLNDTLECIENIKNADVRPFSRGEWKDIKLHHKRYFGTCSAFLQRAECGNYCSHCGSIMRRLTNEE